MMARPQSLLFTTARLAAAALGAFALLVNVGIILGDHADLGTRSFRREMTPAPYQLAASIQAAAADHPRSSGFPSKLNESLHAVASAMSLVKPLLQYCSALYPLLEGSALSQDGKQQLERSVSKLEQVETDLDRIIDLANKLPADRAATLQLQELNRTLVHELANVKEFRSSFQTAFKDFRQALSTTWAKDQGVQHQVEQLQRTAERVANRIYDAFQELASEVHAATRWKSAGTAQVAANVSASTTAVVKERPGAQGAPSNDVDVTSGRLANESGKLQRGFTNLVQALGFYKQDLQSAIQRNLNAHAQQASSELKATQEELTSEVRALSSKLQGDLHTFLAAATRNREGAFQDSADTSNSQHALRGEINNLTKVVSEDVAKIEKEQQRTRRELETALRRHNLGQGANHYPSVGIILLLVLVLAGVCFAVRHFQSGPIKPEALEPLLERSQPELDSTRGRLGVSWSGEAASGTRVLAYKEWPACFEGGSDSWMPAVSVTRREEDIRIEITCPGVEERAIEMRRLPNGAHLKIKGCRPGGGDFEQDFVYDYSSHGYLELREDECAYSNGVVIIVLKHVAERWVTLRTSGKPSVAQPNIQSLVASAVVAVEDKASPELFSLTTFAKSDEGDDDVGAVYEKDWAMLTSSPGVGVEPDAKRALGIACGSCDEPGTASIGAISTGAVHNEARSPGAKLLAAAAASDELV